MRPRCVIFLAVVLALCSLSAAAQVESRQAFRRYTTQDGLPQMLTETLFQDSRGYIYVGTLSGFVRFDREELLLDSLHTIETMLDPQQFVRVDRSTIINRRAVVQLIKRSMVCHLRSADGVELELELTKVAIDHLKNI